MTLINSPHKDKDLIMKKINQYRRTKRLSKLEYVSKIPECIIKGNSLVKFTLNNIFKIENKYLFRYPLGEFLK